jgi:hypothetical protein
MNFKIIKYLINNFGPDEIDVYQAKQFIELNCTTDDIIEFSNLLVYFDNVPNSLEKFIFDKISE